MDPETDLEASPASIDVTEASSAPTDVPADSSTAEALNEARPSLLDVVRNAVEPKAETSEVSPTPEAETTDPVAEAPKAPAEESFDNEPFAKHPRFKKVLEERNALAAKTKELEPLTQEVERLKAPAEQYERIEAFMQKHGLTGQEVVDLYKFGALVKTDPQGALDAIQPYLVDLWTRTGKILPDDLQGEVENGQITEARARELAEQRARAAEATRREAEATKRADTVEESTAQDRQQQAFQARLVDWEAGKKAKDPDYSAKEDLIADRCAALIRQKGQPATPDAMIAILDQAHTDVTERLLKVMPRKPETRKAPVGGTSNNATAQPASFRQALEIAAMRGR
jgi:hypothetical protein